MLNWAWASSSRRRRRRAACRMAMRPTPGTSKIGFISLAPALTALATRLSTSSTARIRHPALGHAVELGAFQREQAADTACRPAWRANRCRRPASAWARRSSRWCRGRSAWRARCRWSSIHSNRSCRAKRSLDASAASSLRLARRLCHDALLSGLRKILRELVEASGPTLAMVVAGLLVEEFLVVEGQQGPAPSGLISTVTSDTRSGVERHAQLKTASRSAPPRDRRR